MINVSSAAQKIADEKQADVILYNGPIYDAGFQHILLNTSLPLARNCFLIMTTYGGDPNAAYRIGRFLQRFYERIYFHPSAICASAGTLVSLCSDIIVVSPFSELGPLDVQLRKNNQLDGRKSGLVTSSALAELRSESFKLFEYVMLEITRKSFGNVDFQTASDVASKVVCGLLSKVYDKIDPEIIGENQRDLSVASEYGIRLSRDKNNINSDSIYKLVHGYPSHDFIIDRNEISSLFKNVEEASSSVLDLIVSLRDRAWKPLSVDLDVERLARPSSISLEETAHADADHHSQSSGESQGSGFSS